MGDLSYLACRLPDKLRLRGEQRPDCQYQEQTPLKVKDFFTAQDQKSQPTTVETSGLCQLEPREAFEAMSLNDKGEQRGLFLSVNQARDGRPEEAYMDNSVVACQSPQPFLTASFGDADYNMSGSSGEEALFAKSGTGHLYPDEEEEEAVGQQEDGGGNRSQQLQEELPELPVMDKSASRQATFTPPPPQPTAQQQQPLSQEVLRTPSGRSHSAMVFLTPKEKYAKEVSAERKLESVQRRVVFDTDAADQFPAQQQQQLPQLQDSLQQQQQPQPSQVEEMPISSPVLTTPSPVKTVKIPLAFKILQAKKKMATQKKLILEHGEVRLTHQQRCKLKPLRKRALKALKPAIAGVNGTGGTMEAQARSEQEQSSFPPGDTSENKAKRIFNRKDKLLAEHRRRQVPSSSSSSPVAAPPDPKKTSPALPDNVSIESRLISEEAAKNGSETVAVAVVLTCPFCSQTSKTRKEHYKHIKVGDT